MFGRSGPKPPQIQLSAFRDPWSAGRSSARAFPRVASQLFHLRGRSGTVRQGPGQEHRRYVPWARSHGRQGSIAYTLQPGKVSNS